MARELLRVTDLATHYTGFGGSRVVKAVDGVSFSLEEGQTIGVVGESGCGKTTLCLSLVRLLAPGAEIVDGSIELGGRDIMELSDKQMVEVRGKEIAMILQDPMTSLNPVINIETQVGESARKHRGLSGGRLRERVRDLLDSVRIPSPEVRMEEFPHQMSGGMRQRLPAPSHYRANRGLSSPTNPPPAWTLRFKPSTWISCGNSKKRPVSA